jgi:hypothetical protein
MTQIQFNLLTDADADGWGTPIRWAGGKGFCGIRGDLGGGTFSMQYCPTDSADTADWFTLDASTTLSAIGSYTFELPSGYIRGGLTGTTGASIDAYVRQI